jgi:NADPH:quinone reductase-like Zn-dependent oxidoreductase
MSITVSTETQWSRRRCRPVIDRTYQLSDAPDAVQYVERGHARGKVIIAI